jgi:hypothetical protein
MYEQLTLHIGMHRTGTTTIQSFLSANRRSLHNCGLFSVVPNSLQSYPQEPGYWKEDRLRGGLHELKHLAKQDGAPGIVWSNEGLATRPFVKDAKCIEIIRRELPASRHRVVIYLRRQDHYLRSAYLQWGIKYKDYPGPVVGFDDWLKAWIGDDFQKLAETGLCYPSIIQPWVDVFGRENVVVRPFEKEQFVDGDLLHDFCAAAALPRADCTFEIPSQNVSYNMELHDMLRMYSSALGESARSTKMIRFLESQGHDEFFSSKHFSKFAIPAECRLKILQRCEESNRRIAKEFLGREDGVLFHEPWPSPDEPYQAYGGLITEKLVPILLHMLQKQDERIVELDERLVKFEMKAKQAATTGPGRNLVQKLKRSVKSLTAFGKDP